MSDATDDGEAGRRGAAPAYTVPERIEMARTVLTRPVPGDARAIFDGWATDPEVTRFLGWRPHRDVDETRAFLGQCDAWWASGRHFPLAIALRDAPDRPVGMIHPQLSGTGTEYGYVLSRAVWGRGIASEALRTLVEHALAHPGIHRARGFCDVENAASRRVMEKAGMVREGVLRRWFVHPNLSDVPRDCVMMARIRD